MLKKTLIASAVLSLMTSIAVAQEQKSNTINIQGDTSIDVDAQDVTVLSNGKGAVAEASIGSIGAGSDVNIKGDTDIKVKAKSITVSSKGKGACAKANIGTIGGTSC